MKYKIYPTLHSEIKKGTVWTYYKTDSNLIKIKNKENKKSIIVAYRFLDKYFEKLYGGDLESSLDSEAIVVDSYYRNKLKLENKEIVNLEIKPVCKYDFISKLKYLSSHPDEVVKITFWFTFLTFIFSLFSYIISFEKLIKIIIHIFNCLIELIAIIFKITNH